MSRKRRQSDIKDEATPPADSGPQKRRRQYTEEDAKLAQLFENLASETEDVRMNAAKEIVKRFSPKSSPTPETVDRAVIRLIRGLCSNRKAARLGFGIALTEVLHQLFGPGSSPLEGLDFSAESIVDLVTERTKPDASAVGQERKDHLIGQIAGYRAILESTILVQPSVPLECWNNLLDRIYELARDKPWLREECGSVLCGTVRNLQSIKGNTKHIEEIIGRLSTYNLAKTPEGIAIWLVTRSLFSQDVLPEDIWRKKDPLCTKERRVLANVLKENFVNVSDSKPKSDSKNVKGGSAHSRPSFAWHFVLQEMLGRESKSDFAKFWIDVVDENLFSASASLERKSWGFQLLNNMLLTAPEWVLPSLFSPNLMRSLINHRSKEDRFLHNATMSPLKAMQTRVEAEPGLAAPFVIALTSKNGNIRFDQLTKTKTVEGLLLLADDDALSKIVQHFNALIIRPEDESDSAAESYRRVIADMLSSLVKGYKGYDAPADILGSANKKSWLRDLLDHFVEFGYFVPKESEADETAPSPPISTSNRTTFRDRISSCLAHLVALRQDSKSQKRTPSGRLVSFPYLVASGIRTRARSSKTLNLVFEADDEVLDTVKKAHKHLKTIESQQSSSEAGKSATNDAFILLYSLTILQVYNGDSDAVSILSELDVCYTAISGKTDSDSESSFDLLLELLLSFLAKPSTLLRKLAEQVFTTFTASVTRDSLGSLIDILYKSENLSGQQELFDQNADEADGSELDENKDSGDDSDVEMIDGELDSDVEVEDGDVPSDSESDDEADSSDKDDEEAARFEALLAGVLKTDPQNGEASDAETSDGEDMDDEEMMALEPHLTKIFQERKKTTSKKKENKNARETMLNFKNRVLDLLLIYVKKQHQNPLALGLILPVLRLVRMSTSKQLSEKSFNLLKEYFEACKKGLPKPEAQEQLWEILKTVHEEVKIDGSKLHGNACSKSSLFVVKVLVAMDRENRGKATDVYKESEREWNLDPSSKVQSGFFSEWLNWCIQTRRQK
ncbi:uncharacterized protein BDZ99DRAFT_536019 [Mytilinidion resinicola]|uniref:DNA polymerase V n=1 Tax=Mytilinidion resinicola TaxID=574789 RepID=A0A6A6YHP2_9PEZI|nr:uncharacterized protein BDZ99DRAFT_536019 [Mytilinidion resinicola]KAF2808043.1 hypothetical protein BDZ99DRAFT_536019 [Mytilinidion resinicola]